jgi:hypothetical protein
MALGGMMGDDMAERRVLRCPRCGSAARVGDERCPRCGALLESVLSAPPYIEDAGVPIQRFATSVAGPPIPPEPFAQPDRLHILPSARPRILSYGVVRPLKYRRRSRAGLFSLLALITLVIAGLAIGVGAQRLGGLARDNLPFLFPAATATFTQEIPTATVPVACAVVTVDPTAAAALTSAQLTTGVRDASKQDYRPIDSVRRFTTGQQAYLTFKIATAQAGKAGVSFCAPSGVVPGLLDIPAGSQERFAQFSTRFAPQDAGVAVVTLTWNGAVAASLPFTVDPPATVPAP